MIPNESNYAWILSKFQERIHAENYMKKAKNEETWRFQQLDLFSREEILIPLAPGINLSLVQLEKHE